MSAPTASDVLAGRDLRGQTHVVTGAESGIGQQTARALALAGARVVLGCRRDEDGRAAADLIRAEHPAADLIVSPFDLGRASDVVAAAAAMPPPTSVICNAGVYGGAFVRTADGVERTFGVCYLGHVRLVDALLPRMAPGARVVVVSSQNHRWPTRLRVDRLPPREEDHSELRSYGVAKLCGLLWCRAFARRSGAPGVTANGLHPGDLIATGIDRDSWVLGAAFALVRPFTRTPAQAAATSVWVATAPELDGVSGRYFVDRREQLPSWGARQDDVADALWDQTRTWLAG